MELLLETGAAKVFGRGNALPVPARTGKGNNFDGGFEGSSLLSLDKYSLNEGSLEKGIGDGSRGDDCGDAADEDDMVWIGENDSYRVCERCCDNEYVHAIGRRGYEYYVHSGNATWVEDSDRYYEDEYMNDNGIVHCEDDGEYHHRDNCLYLDHRDEWVTQDSDRAVYCEDTGNYEHIDDCVELDDGRYALEEDAKQCEHSDKWYSINEDFIETPCGKTIHPDYIDEYIEEGEGQ